jgi:hypothetical protein
MSSMSEIKDKSYWDEEDQVWRCSRTGWEVVISDNESSDNYDSEEEEESDDSDDSDPDGEYFPSSDSDSE